jgi:hypothetical protein
MTLGAEVIDFVRTNGAQQFVKRTGIVQVGIDQAKAGPGFVWITIKVIDSFGVEAARSANRSVNLVALAEQKLGKVGAVLAGDTRNQGAFAKFFRHVFS